MHRLEAAENSSESFACSNHSSYRCRSLRQHRCQAEDTDISWKPLEIAVVVGMLDFSHSCWAWHVFCSGSASCYLLSTCCCCCCYCYYYYFLPDSCELRPFWALAGYLGTSLILISLLVFVFFIQSEVFCVLFLFSKNVKISQTFLEFLKNGVFSIVLFLNIFFNWFNTKTCTFLLFSNLNADF